MPEYAAVHFDRYFTETEEELSPLEALKALVEAIDFEGERGRIAFNPGGPWELDVLRDARAAIAKAVQS